MCRAGSPSSGQRSQVTLSGPLTPILCVVVVLLAGLITVCGSRDESRAAARTAPASTADPTARPNGRPARAVVPLSVEPRLPADARTYEDRKDRLRVKLPADWHRASDRATDRLSLMEANLLAVGTSPIRPRPENACSDDVGEPRVDVGPTDALVVVEEDVRARADLARKRPRFRLLEQVAPPGKSRRARTGVFPAWPCRNDVGISGPWEPWLADGDRVFGVAAIIGQAATEKTRSETLAVLNSLKPLGD